MYVFKLFDYYHNNNNIWVMMVKWSDGDEKSTADEKR